MSVVSVCPQETVTAVIGGSVVLPCSSTEGHKLQETDVHWRDHEDKIVHSIIKGKDLVAGEGSRYKNRVETFPQEYEGGNFSIKLTGLNHTDAGKYICHITPSDELKTIQLIINGV